MPIPSYGQYYQNQYDTSRKKTPSYSYSPYVSSGSKPKSSTPSVSSNPELKYSRRYQQQRQNYQATNPETRYANRSSYVSRMVRRQNQQRRRAQMARRNAYSSYNYGGGSYGQSPSSSAYGRYVYSGSLDPTERIMQGYDQQRQEQMDRFQRWSQGQANYLGIQKGGQPQMEPAEFMKLVGNYMNTQKDPMYTPQQFMNLVEDYMRGPVAPLVQGTLPPPQQPPPLPEYGGGYGGYGGYGYGGYGGRGGGGGGYSSRNYLPSAYSPYDYGQGVEQSAPVYGNAQDLSLWNI